MENINLNVAEINKMVNAFSQIRLQLSQYMNERNFNMSNAQIFAFLLYSPLCLAISCDRVIDEQELKLLEKITKNVDVKKLVSVELFEVLTAIPEPQNTMFNEEFNMRIDAELLHIARNIAQYEQDIMQSARYFLSLSNDPTAATSIAQIYSKWFDFILSNSVSKQKDTEKLKIKEYKDKLGL